MVVEVVVVTVVVGEVVVVLVTVAQPPICPAIHKPNPTDRVEVVYKPTEREMRAVVVEVASRGSEVKVAIAAGAVDVRSGLVEAARAAETEEMLNW